MQTAQPPAAATSNVGLRLARRSGARRVVAGMAPMLALYVLYTLIRWAVADRGPVVGGRHALWVLDAERWLRLDWELSLQQVALPAGPLVWAANWYYVAGFLPVIIGCAVAAAWKAGAAFAWWRRVFVCSLGIALLGYALFPLTPPRLLAAEYGYVDTLLLYGPRYYGDAQGSSLFNAYGSMPSMVNVYAAMPSMHVAWSIIAAALFVAVMGRRRWAVALAILHPTLMALAVVVTANHYVLDVVAGVVVLALAIGLARVLPALVTHRRGAARPVAAAAD